jgi:hypothetical protein
MKMLKITDRKDRNYLVNPNHIIAVLECDDGAQVLLTNTNDNKAIQILVNESMLSIKSKLEALS